MYSYSRLSAFETCPRKYWYQYIGRPEIERIETVEAFLGSCVHDALEELYRRRTGGQIMSCDELLGVFDASWENVSTDGVRIVRQQFAAADYIQVGRESLTAYYSRYFPFDQARTLRVEGLISLTLDGDGRYQLKGYIDRLDQRSDGSYEVHDYKTSQHLPTQAEAEEDRQLALYQIGVQQMWPDAAKVDLVWHYLRFDKEIRSRRSPEQLQAVRQQCIAMIDDIECRGKAESNFRTSPSNLCDWCEFRCLCPATKHHVAVEALPPRNLRPTAGYSSSTSWLSCERRSGN